MKSTKVMSIALAAIVTVGLSACNDYSSPAGVLGTAGTALKKEDSKAFRKTLTGDAKTQYGNLKAMAELQGKLAGAGELKVGKTDLVKSDRDRLGMQDKNTYTVEVLAGAAMVLNATVVCQVSYDFSPCNMPTRGTYCSPDMDGYSCRYPNGTDTRYTWCSRDSWEQPAARTVASTFCQISDLKVLN